MKFDDGTMRVNFGVRYGTRTASNENFALVAPVYGGNGAYNNPVDPATGLEDTTVQIPNLVGCNTRYTTYKSRRNLDHRCTGFNQRPVGIK